MQGGDADPLDRGAVLGGRVTDVLVEAPAGMLLGDTVHVAIAGDLGYHRGGSDRGARAIALDHGAVRHRALTQGEAVDQAGGPLARRQSLQRTRQRFDVGHVQAARVDPAHATDDDAHPTRRPQHRRVQLLPLLRPHLLGVVQTPERPPVRAGERLVVEQHRGGNQRPGEAASASLIGTRYLATAETAVEGKEALRPCQAPLTGP